MKRIYYSSGSVLTGDRLASGIVEYAASLARSTSADHVSLPVITDDGRVGHAELLVGPASELVALDEESDEPELEDAALCEFFEARARELAVPRPLSVPADSESLALTDDDLY